MAGTIPIYRQTAGFSCGAASLVMALARLRGATPGRGLEFELWREGTMIGTRGMDQWGLTIPALRRGIAATIITTAPKTFPEPSDTARKRFTEEELELTDFAQGENRRIAESLGARWERREPAVDDVRRALAAGQVPVLLVDLLTLSKEYAAPHWVVAVQVEGDEAVLHDPDADGPGVWKLSVEEAWSATDVSRYLAQPTLVVLGP